MNNFEDFTIPAAAGIGLRAPHYQEIANNKPDIPWLELHPENFFSDGGISIHMLERIRENYPISFHGVGLSLGSFDGIREGHLKKLKNLIDRFNPAFVSEHISWSNIGEISLNDLLPLPYTNESLNVICKNIDQTQNYLNRQIFVENPSTYLEFKDSTMSEEEFLNKIVEKTNCKILLDINNIYVIHKNHGINPEEYLKNIPSDYVGEIHLAGHDIRKIKDKEILIDHHGDFINDNVWQLYRLAISLLGKKPTLIEWDTNIPSLSDLTGEANKAEQILDEADNA